jgi:hypothetical protein
MGSTNEFSVCCGPIFSFPCARVRRPPCTFRPRSSGLCTNQGEEKPQEFGAARDRTKIRAIGARSLKSVSTISRIESAVEGQGTLTDDRCPQPPRNEPVIAKSRAHATHLSPSIRRSQGRIWFQLVNVWGANQLLREPLESIRDFRPSSTCSQWTASNSASASRAASAGVPARASASSRRHLDHAPVP